MVRKKGLFSFFEDGHHECCFTRKVEPLERKTRELDVWITGLRQNTNFRQKLPPVEQKDHLLKFNPLYTWTSEQIWAYQKEHQVPMNDLFRKGYKSIGCAPCTRATAPHEDERAGRWFYEKTDGNNKECGIHNR
jgi:phosphoadenosine phosphosulfate reductase